jgi:hypothetical protein
MILVSSCEKLMQIPILKPSSRDREFRQRDAQQISRIIHGWLFSTDLGHREMDKDILGLDPLSSKGWQSMGVLHFLGLKKEFKGIFASLSLEEAINYLEKDNQDFSSIIKFLNTPVSDLASKGAPRALIEERSKQSKPKDTARSNLLVAATKIKVKEEPNTKKFVLICFFIALTFGLIYMLGHL